MQVFREFLNHSDSRWGKLLLVVCLVFVAAGRTVVQTIDWLESPFLGDDEESVAVRPWFWFITIFFAVIGVFIVLMYMYNTLN